MTKNQQRLEGLIYIILGIACLLAAYKVLLAIVFTIVGFLLINKGLSLYLHRSLTTVVMQWWMQQKF